MSTWDSGGMDWDDPDAYEDDEPLTDLLATYTALTAADIEAGDDHTVTEALALLTPPIRRNVTADGPPVTITCVADIERVMVERGLDRAHMYRWTGFSRTLVDAVLDGDRELTGTALAGFGWALRKTP